MGITSITDAKDANIMLGPFLGKFNGKLTVVSQRAVSAYMRLNKDTNLDLVFAARAERKVGGVNTVSYEGSLYMPAESGVFIKPGTTVEVRQTAAGKIYVMHKGEAILMKTIDMAAKAILCPETNKAGVASTHKPAYYHPWRSGYRNSENHDTTNTTIVTFSQNI